MILDMSSELQKPEGMPEPPLYAEALEQVVLADELGYGCWWSVEYHDTGHFRDCSTSDLMLTLISQHSEQIHLGHSGVLAPFDAVIIGDVDRCRRKLERCAECGVDRLMCLMQMGLVPHETVMKSIRTAGKHLVPQLAAFERFEA